MRTAPATYKDASIHYSHGKPVIIKIEGEYTSVCFSQKSDQEEHLEDIRFGGKTTDKLNGEWFVVENRKENNHGK